MIALACFVILIAALVTLARLTIGPTLYDRVLAVNSFGTKTVLFLCLFAGLMGRGDAVDIAILYALINFIATIAILKFFRYRSLEQGLSQGLDPAPDMDEASPVAATPAPAPARVEEGA